MQLVLHSCFIFGNVNMVNILPFLRLSYNPHMIGRLLCDFLDSGKICFKCRRWCISCIYGIGCTFLNDLAQEVISSGDRYVPIEIYYCSLQCFNGKMHKIQMDWLR